MFHMVETIAWIMPNLYGVPLAWLTLLLRKHGPLLAAQLRGLDAKG